MPHGGRLPPARRPTRLRRWTRRRSRRSGIAARTETAVSSGGHPWQRLDLLHVHDVEVPAGDEFGDTCGGGGRRMAFDAERPAGFNAPQEGAAPAQGFVVDQNRSTRRRFPLPARARRRHERHVGASRRQGLESQRCHQAPAIGRRKGSLGRDPQDTHRGCARARRMSGVRTSGAGHACASSARPWTPDRRITALTGEGSIQYSRRPERSRQVAPREPCEGHSCSRSGDAPRRGCVDGRRPVRAAESESAGRDPPAALFRSRSRQRAGHDDVVHDQQLVGDGDPGARHVVERLGVPVFSFNVYLTGTTPDHQHPRRAQRDVAEYGQRRSGPSRTRISPQGPLLAGHQLRVLQRDTSAAGRAGRLPSLSARRLDRGAIELPQRAMCVANLGTPAIARGYITVNTANACALLSPDDGGYFRSVHHGPERVVGRLSLTWIGARSSRMAMRSSTFARTVFGLRT